MKELYIFWGKVITGKKRGAGLGFPTANVRLHRKIPEGIYASEVRVDRKKYHAATFVGSAKTFGEKEYKAESFLLDFSGNLYGKWIIIRIYKKIRDNKKFNSEKELIEQMKNDILRTREFFS